MNAERESLRVGRSLRIPIAEIALRYETSGGAGGQHANRARTRVEASFDVLASATLSTAQRDRIVGHSGAVISAVAADSRSQRRNRELALDRLADKVIAALHVERPRRPTKPTKGSQRRRLDSKRRTGERKKMRKRPTQD